MRLSMMPTTKKKLGSIGLFMRQADGSLSGPGSSSPRAGVVGLPATPAPATHAHLPQLQPPPEIIAARQDRQLPDTPATARSIPAPRAGRYAAASQPTATAAATMSLPAQQQHQHFHPMQRTRTSASDTARDGQRGHNAWEDSTVASMFGDNESRAASEMLRVPQGGHGRHHSDAPQPRPLQLQQPSHQPSHQPTRTTQHRHDENLPFVIGENGMLKVIAPPSTHKAAEATVSAAPLATSAAPGGIFDDQTVKPEDLYHEARQPFETLTRTSGLRRTKLAYRDNRDLKSNASSDRTGPGYSPESQSLNLSPERPAEAGEHIDKIRLQERLTRDRERQRERDREREKERQREQERDLQHKRSTVFENLTPLEFDYLDDFNDTKAAVLAPSTAVDAEALKEALNRTPKASRPTRQPQQQLFPPQNKLLNEVPPPLGRTGSRRLREPSQDAPPPPTSRKRRQSLDYNDAELHAMSYADLRAQAFDFDPQAATLQQQQQQTAAPSAPAGGTLEDRLEHYRTQGTLDQHEFFARATLDEWDEAGDWFLARFGGVVQRMREARKAKRQIVARFEAEISTREEAVRGKVEGIARTLEDLKQEGQTMMQGKDMDVDF